MRRLLLLFLFFPLSLHAATLIEQAYQAGTLDLETTWLYQVQAARDPELLPAPYRQEPRQPFCGTPLILQALEAGQTLTPDYNRRLAKTLARPTMHYSQVSPSGNFRVHYDLSGDRAVDPRDADGNGIPDYVDEVIRALEQVWVLQIDELGYQPPPSDKGRGGGPEYDVYIVELGRGGAYGFTYPESGGTTASSYMEIDNNYTDSIYRQTRGLDAMRVTVAHEFFHAVQFGYYQGSDGIWWQEATSTWMEKVVYPEIDDYLQYLDSFLMRPEKALDGGSRFSSDLHIYGASLFAHFLDQGYERRLIRHIWEELGRRRSASMEHFDLVLRRPFANGMADAISEFAIWNYFTGHRHVEGYYQQGDQYPAAQVRSLALDFNVPKVPVERVDRLDRLASTYLYLKPGLSSGGVSIDFMPQSGRWNRQLILISQDSIAVLPVHSMPRVVPGWDQYQEVVLVLTVTELTGAGYEYQASVIYDPELTDAPMPVVQRLEQNYPNPFRPAVHGETIFPFSLNRSSAATWLSVFSIDGRPVRVFELGARAPRQYAQSWDGANDAGEPVGSGIYYGVLEANGKKLVRTLAVIRD